MGDFIRCHTWSLMKEGSGSLPKPGEVLASGETFKIWQDQHTQLKFFLLEFRFRVALYSPLIRPKKAVC